MFLQRLDGVAAAGRSKPAAGANPVADRPLIKTNQLNQCPNQGCRQSAREAVSLIRIFGRGQFRIHFFRPDRCWISGGLVLPWRRVSCHASRTSEILIWAKSGVAPALGRTTKSIPWGKSRCWVRKASRISLFQRLRTTALPTLRPMLSPSRGGQSGPVILALMTSIGSAAKFRDCQTASKSRWCRIRDWRLNLFSCGLPPGVSTTTARPADCPRPADGEIHPVPAVFLPVFFVEP